ncbi:cytochrome b N-terminal domain-containing protein [Geoalkalibacter halelectricus]|uniref:Cytochrome b N-terminal domain-containing protein n=1 Tax=Geoalkalibacter halelectricus TaxID=2847045 RepID=A0ABY5ZRJ8_9BACT|nr:cytochrome b N-terminal domain-containing protein [Geoalkalibacter halelectricus]UWZ80572.1 cytochrome b N-terminal domain-containing protein [Geoalkalibacter halelectricus]
MSAKRNFLHHLHPPQVCRRTLEPTATLGLGIACLTCLAVLFVTGATLFLYYVPDPERAYERILHITTTLRYGDFIRNLHFIAANALAILIFAHLARVFFTAAYKERYLNWLYGLVLLGLVLFGNFTGYLLPWDQVAYWAIKVGASLAAYLPYIGEGVQRFFLGGTDIGPETLLRSFAFHAGFVPLMLVVFTSLHLWRIRKDGGLAAPAEARKQRLPAAPWLYRAEGAVALATLGTLIALSLIIDAPLHERADPVHPPNPAKAPWYFVGFQEMVGYSAFLGGVAAPAALLAFFTLAPLLDRTRSEGGIWFARDRLALNLLFAAVMVSQIAFIVIGQWFRGKNWALIWPF